MSKKWKLGYDQGYELGFEAGKRNWAGGRTVQVLGVDGQPLYVFVALPGQITEFELPEIAAKQRIGKILVTE